MPPRWRAAMAVAAIILPELSESLSAQYSYECAPGRRAASIEHRAQLAPYHPSLTQFPQPDECLERVLPGHSITYAQEHVSFQTNMDWIEAFADVIFQIVGPKDKKAQNVDFLINKPADP